MKRIILLVLLGAGTVAGYAHGFRMLRDHGCADGSCFRGAWRDNNDAHLERVAEACVRAAKDADTPVASPPQP
jgi:hypothetical protein